MIKAKVLTITDVELGEVLEHKLLGKMILLRFNRETWEVRDTKGNIMVVYPYELEKEDKLERMALNTIALGQTALKEATSGK